MEVLCPGLYLCSATCWAGPGPRVKFWANGVEKGMSEMPWSGRTWGKSPTAPLESRVVIHAGAEGRARGGAGKADARDAERRPDAASGRAAGGSPTAEVARGTAGWCSFCHHTQPGPETVRLGPCPWGIGVCCEPSKWVGMSTLVTWLVGGWTLVRLGGPVGKVGGWRGTRTGGCAGVVGGAAAINEGGIE